MKILTSVLYTKNDILEKNILEIISHFYSMEMIEIIRDNVSCIEKLNLINPDLLFIDMENDSMSMIDLINLINKPPFIIGIMPKVDEIPLLLDNGFYDFLLTDEIKLDYFCKKMSKVIKLVHSLNSKYQLPIVQESPIFYDSKNSGEIKKDWMFVKYKKSSIKVKYDEILYIKNVGNALKLFLLNDKYIYHNSTLKKFLQLLPEEKFIRINNSTIINLTKIDKYEKNRITIQNEIFNVSRIYSEKLKKNLNVI